MKSSLKSTIAALLCVLLLAGVLLTSCADQSDDPMNSDMAGTETDYFFETNPDYNYGQDYDPGYDNGRAPGGNPSQSPDKDHYESDGGSYDTTDVEIESDYDYAYGIHNYQDFLYEYETQLEKYNELYTKAILEGRNEYYDQYVQQMKRIESLIDYISIISDEFSNEISNGYYDEYMDSFNYFISEINRINKRFPHEFDSEHESRDESEYTTEYPWDTVAPPDHDTDDYWDTEWDTELPTDTVVYEKYVITPDGFEFELHDYGYMLTSYTGSANNVVIPSEILGIPVAGISHSVFSNNLSITSVSIPDSVTSIGSYAFAGCTNLTSLNIPDSVTIIDQYAFENCVNLFDTENGIVYVDKWIIDCDDSVDEVNIRTNTYGIAKKAFSECYNLTSITIPASVENICYFAFYSCGLETVTINANVTALDSWTFAYCEELKEVIINSDNITFIGAGAFAGCSIEAIVIPESVTHMGPRVFENCDELTSVTFEDPSDWFAFNLDDYISYDVDVSDPTTAAGLLRTEYCEYYWAKKN